MFFRGRKMWGIGSRPEQRADLPPTPEVPRKPTFLVEIKRNSFFRAFTVDTARELGRGGAAVVYAGILFPHNPTEPQLPVAIKVFPPQYEGIISAYKSSALFTGHLRQYQQEWKVLRELGDFDFVVKCFHAQVLSVDNNEYSQLIPEATWSNCQKLVEVLRTVPGCRITKVADLFEPKVGLLVLELLDGEESNYRNLHKLIFEDKYVFTGIQLSLLAFYLIFHVHQLTKKGVGHRDLKPANLYVSPKEGMALKIADFNVSSGAKAPINPKNGINATYGYSAPEVFSGDWSERSELWSIVMILLVAVLGEFPRNSPERGLNPYDYIPHLSGGLLSEKLLGITQHVEQTAVSDHPDELSPVLDQETKQKLLLTNAGNEAFEGIFELLQQALNVESSERPELLDFQDQFITLLLAAVKSQLELLS